MLEFLTGKLGSYAIAAVLATTLGMALYVGHLRLAAKDSEIAGLHGQMSGLSAQLKDAATINKRQKDVIDAATDDLASARKRAEQTASDLAAARSQIDQATKTVLQKVKDASTVEDDAPIPPGMRAALAGLRDLPRTDRDRH